MLSRLKDDSRHQVTVAGLKTGGMGDELCVIVLGISLESELLIARTLIPYVPSWGLTEFPNEGVCECSHLQGKEIERDRGQAGTKAAKQAVHL